MGNNLNNLSPPSCHGDPGCEVQSITRQHTGNRNGSGHFTEEQCFKYINANRTCPLSIQKKGFKQRVNEIRFVHLDNVHDSAQAEIVVTMEDTGAGLSCQLARFSGNLKQLKRSSNSWLAAMADTYVGYHRPQGYSVFGFTSGRVRFIPFNSHVAVVEHYCHNRGANASLHVRVLVELQEHEQRGLSTKVWGPLTTREMPGLPAALIHQQGGAVASSQPEPPPNPNPHQSYREQKMPGHIITPCQPQPPANRRWGFTSSVAVESNQHNSGRQKLMGFINQYGYTKVTIIIV